MWGSADMVGRTKPLVGIVVAFIRDGEEIDTQVAPTGKSALKRALLMLAKLDHLQDGDRLVVTETR
jgi:hypothetical protein